MQTADIDAIEAGHCERAEKSKDDNYCCGRNCDCCGSTRVRIHSGNHSHVGIRLCKYPICEIPNLRRCLWLGCAHFRTPRVSPGSGSERRNWGDCLPYSQRMSVARLMARSLTLQRVAGLGLSGHHGRLVVGGHRAGLEPPRSQNGQELPITDGPAFSPKRPRDWPPRRSRISQRALASHSGSFSLRSSAL